MFYVINNVHYIKDGNQIYKTNLISLKKKTKVVNMKLKRIDTI